MRFDGVKTVRFETLVQAAGNPHSHLVLTDPEKDSTLRSAVKANRVVTIYQPAVGTRTHHGAVAFDPGPSRQFLIFPRGVGKFKARRIVGIKYDLLGDADAPIRKKKPPSLTKNRSQRKKPAQPREPTTKSPRNPPRLKVLPPPPDLAQSLRRALEQLEAGRRNRAVKTLEHALAEEKAARRRGMDA
jgi:hypothetical protein